MDIRVITYTSNAIRPSRKSFPVAYHFVPVEIRHEAEMAAMGNLHNGQADEFPLLTAVCRVALESRKIHWRIQWNIKKLARFWYAIERLESSRVWLESSWNRFEPSWSRLESSWSWLESRWNRLESRWNRAESSLSRVESSWSRLEWRWSRLESSWKRF